MTKKRVLRQDVADAAGVSGATVSYVMNGQAEAMKITAETAGRVRRVASELGYRPHATARELRRGRTDRVTVVLWLGHRPFWVPILEAMNRQARERGYHLLLAFRDREEPLDEVLLPALEQTDGAVVIAGSLAAEAVAGCRGTDKPVVLVNHWPLDGFTSVVTPTSELLSLTTGHLLDEGWDEVLLTSDLPHFVTGFQEALASRGRPYDDSTIIGCGLTYQSGADLAAELGESMRGRGLVTASDLTAMGAMSQFAKLGLQAGRDYGITGLHNHDAGEWLQVPLTTAQRPYQQIAGVGLDLLLGQRSETAVAVPGRLVVRASSRRAGGRS